MDEESKKHTIPMGIGPIGKPDALFVRQFRFTLEAPGLSEQFVETVGFDFHAQKMHIGFRELSLPTASIGELHAWLKRPVGPIRFVTYDGCGSPIYEKTFDGLTLLADTCQFDYKSNDMVTRFVTVHYVNMTEQTHVHSGTGVVSPFTFDLPVISKEPRRKKADKSWGLLAEGIDHPVTVDCRPTLEVEETEVRRLNATMIVPGKHRWQPMKLTMHPAVYNRVREQLRSGTVCLRLLDSKLQALECWSLLGIQLQSINFGASSETTDGPVELTLTFDHVKYEPLCKENADVN